MKRLLLLFVLVLVLPGCARLATYERTYSVTYGDASGRTVAASVRLTPGGFAK